MGLREQPIGVCGRCGSAGDFTEPWQLCGDCTDVTYGRLDPARYVSWLLRSIGEDPSREGLRETPRRVVRMLHELTVHQPFVFTTFASEGMSEMIVQSPIPFWSLCEHHMLPFGGEASVAYVPNGRIVGLSKLARAVQYCAIGLQNQERITTAVADMLEQELAPEGLGVILRARHLCMEMRGVQAAGVYTTTSCLRGALMDKAEARAEFLHLTR